MTVKQAWKIRSQLISEDAQGVLGHKINQANFAIVRAIRSHFGKAYLISLRNFPPVQEYEGGKIEPFRYDFVVPELNREVLTALKDAIVAEKRGGHFYFEKSQAVKRAIYHAGGMMLLWVA